MTTLDSLPGQDLLPMALPLMSSPAASRARTSQLLAMALASRVRDLVCGRNIGDCLARWDQDGQSWRTSQACLIEGWQRYSETWPRSGLMLGGTAYPRQPLAPLTDVTEYGSLPTPAATSYGSNQGGGMGRAGPIRPSLAAMAKRNQWPTPTAGDAKASGSRNTPTSKAHRGTSLTDAVRGDGGTGRWPTPHANCWTGPGWSGPGRGRNLQTAVQFPTPAARDHRYPNKVPHKLRRKNLKGEQLPNAIGGPLNPRWVEWLMGYPDGWTDLKRSAMPLFRRLSK